MTFQDIFTSGFLDSVSSVSLLDMAAALGLAFALGLFIFLIYKKTFSGVMYSSGFGISLIAMTMITTLVILAVSSNVVLSLGMVGALSIVRFRTAVKDPMDIVFLFWSIGAGIVLAAGLLPLAVFGSIFIGLVLLIFAEKKTFDKPYILVVHCSGEKSEREVFQMITEKTSRVSLKSKSVSAGMVELNYEVRLKEEDISFVNMLAEIDGVTNTVMASYNGDYMG
ncbi:MAG TPA: DUF4956 domain-containing protein [Candidatus Copromorpha excrementigallinarum]|uniref:DUF4956 domain-containing protein n=1 Tax=Candidatus Allocopromorpha excrementigallinarum TaxID=2840742 RepID=A0A9D1HYQ4_9FIRM|nr:DUF4956 domain-containing protein [Candidatus Copromorpha excrementigallinarum]